MILSHALLGLALALQPGAPPIAIGETPLDANTLPPKLEGVGITEKTGTVVPTHLSFTNHEGKTVTLAEVLAGDRPTILTFNYSDCPMLCSVMLNGLVESLKQMDWTLGKEFNVVTISIDPDETPDRAALTRERYLGDYGKEVGPDAWPFLVGDEPTIVRLAESVGFGYRLNPDNGEWLHTATLILLTGDETVSRYLYGVQYSPKTTQLSLTEASEGKLGSPVDQLILYCFAYDAHAGTYTPVIANIMRLAGAFTVVVMFGFVLRTILRSRKKKKNEDDSSDELAAGEPDRSAT